MAMSAVSPCVCRRAPSFALNFERRGCNGSLKSFSEASLPRRSLLSSLVFNSVMLGSSSFSVSARSKLSEVEEILKNVEWPEEFPFKKEDFQRYDESPDTLFYGSPRFVTHIDDSAIQALTKFYASVFPPSNTPGVALLDMCSSWISHYPKGYKQERISGLGLNEEELKRNPVLTDYIVQDLNQNTILPYGDNSFDMITNAVSVDYLARPLEIFKEMRRVLKPGGVAIMSFSNRCFWTKAISIWTGTGDVDHAYIVGCYFHFAGGYEPPQALDISPNPGRTDPIVFRSYRPEIREDGLPQNLTKVFYGSIHVVKGIIPVGYRSHSGNLGKS